MASGKTVEATMNIQGHIHSGKSGVSKHTRDNDGHLNFDDKTAWRENLRWSFKTVYSNGCAAASTRPPWESGAASTLTDATPKGQAVMWVIITPVVVALTLT